MSETLSAARLPTLLSDESARVGGADFDIKVRGDTLWCTRKATSSASVTLAQLHQQRALDDSLLRGDFGAVKWKVLRSAQPSIFSLGGDLDLFLSCIRQNDHDTLLQYAVLAAHCVWLNASGFGARRLRTVALVEGEAQGGGFEAALSCHWIIATRGSSFGFPESLFGMRPGMGGRLMLAGRIGSESAEKMVSSANRYSAEFLHEIGVVDMLVSDKEGYAAAEELIRLGRPPGLDAKPREPSRLRFENFLEEVEAWVDETRTLSPKHQRSMRYLLDAQRKSGKLPAS